MEAKYDQASFTLGEIDPKTQKRTDWDGYYKSLKRLRNGLVIPQGGVTGRWGTEYVDALTIVDVERPLEAELYPYIYEDNATYVTIWEDLSLKIYLENLLVATVVSPYPAEDVPNIRIAQIQDRLIIASGRLAPYQLVRSANAGNVISGFDGTNNYLQLTTPITADLVYPVTFTTTGTLPATNPSIYVGVTYFIYGVSTTNVRIYATAAEAKAGINYFTVSSAGTGTNTLFIQNTWALTAIAFKFYPAYDFTGGYNAITFTPSATTGASVVITASAAIFTTAMVGGLFTGNGGILRITIFTDSTHVTGYTVEDFTSTDPILGTLAFLGEPAWSNARGWPALVSGYQSRSVFARTTSIPNGRWMSVVNDVYNFDDSQKLDDDAISTYPNGAGSGYVQALTSARTLVVHTNTNVQSTPVLNEVPITPLNATYPEQSKFGTIPVQPIFLDNQIIFVDRAYNVISMIWEITQSAFVTSNISVPSSGLIREVIDMTAYAQPVATDGFYALFINSDGTMASYQTLIEENVKGWSLMNTKTAQVADTSYNGTDVTSSFVRVGTAGDRCWMTVTRQIPTAASPVAITAFSGITNTLTAASHGLSLTAGTIISFTTAGTLPVTDVQINITQYWFGRGVDANTFAIYASQADADADTNRLIISSAGTSSNVVRWPLAKKVYLEELSFDVRADSCKLYDFAVPTTTVTGLSHLNGCVVKVVADGYILTDKVVFNGSITMEIEASEVIVGSQFIVTIVPLPLSLPGIMGVLYGPTHIRAMYIAYVDSIGVTIQGGDIPIIDMQDVILDAVPEPKTGVYLYTPMEGWDGFSYDLEITQANPLPITITAFSYKMEAV